MRACVVLCSGVLCYMHVCLCGAQETHLVEQGGAVRVVYSRAGGRGTPNLIPGKYESAALILSIKSLRSFNMAVWIFRGKALSGVESIWAELNWGEEMTSAGGTGLGGADGAGARRRLPG